MKTSNLSISSWLRLATCNLSRSIRLRLIKLKCIMLTVDQIDLNLDGIIRTRLHKGSRSSRQHSGCRTQRGPRTCNRSNSARKRLVLNLRSDRPFEGSGGNETKRCTEILSRTGWPRSKHGWSPVFQKRWRPSKRRANRLAREREPFLRAKAADRDRPSRLLPSVDFVGPHFARVASRTGTTSRSNTDASLWLRCPTDLEFAL